MLWLGFRAEGLGAAREQNVRSSRRCPVVVATEVLLSVAAMESAGSAASGVCNPWTYATGRLDSETGLLYLRNRYQKVEFGRFCTVDPLGGWVDRGALGNAYCYGSNASPMRVDPSGLLSLLGKGGSSGGGLGGGVVSQPQQGPGGDVSFSGGSGQGEGQGQCSGGGGAAAGAGGGGSAGGGDDGDSAKALAWLNGKDEALASILLGSPIESLDLSQMVVSFDVDMPNPATAQENTYFGPGNASNPSYSVGHGFVTVTYFGHTVSWGFYSTTESKDWKGANPFWSTTKGDFRREVRDPDTGATMHSRADVSAEDRSVSAAEFARLRDWINGRLSGSAYYSLCGRVGGGNCATSMLQALGDYVGQPYNMDKSFKGAGDWVSPGEVGNFMQSAAGVMQMAEFGLSVTTPSR